MKSVALILQGGSVGRGLGVGAFLTFLLLAQAAGEMVKGLTCISIRKGGPDCGVNTEACCSHSFQRQGASWGCHKTPKICDNNFGGCVQAPIRDQPGEPAIICTCATNHCNGKEAWKNDPVFKEWKRSVGGSGGGTTPLRSNAGLASTLLMVVLYFRWLITSEMISNHLP